MSGRWRKPLQAAIAALERGEVAQGQQACERLLSATSLPADVASLVRERQLAHAPALSEMAPSTARHPISIPVERGWSRFNPSIAANPSGDGFSLIVRTSNYIVDSRLRYRTVDGDPVVRTANDLVTLDAALTVRGVERIDDGDVRESAPRYHVTGFEDARLVEHGGTWWLSATVRDRNPDGICQIALLRLDGARVTAMDLLSTGRERHEKNWMPVVGSADRRLRFIYSVSPTIVVTYDDVKRGVEPEVARPGPRLAKEFRGGSQAIPFDGGHLCLVHERAEGEAGQRVYAHRWVWFDAGWRLARLSLPFVFQHRGIEFAAGLARRGDELIVSYGTWDREAWLETVALADVVPLLAPPLDAGRIEIELRASDTVAHRPAASHAVKAVHEVNAGSAEPAIVSMTLAGNSRQIIGAALRSVVEWVDRCLVIDTGITDDTLAIARQVAGEKLIVRSYPWSDDFAAARNAALAAARETSAAWAVMLDTDERLRPDRDPRPALIETDATVLRVMHVDGTYAKERFFRLPVAGRFAGPTHEAFVLDEGATATLNGISFEELEKSTAAYRRKAERDIAILTAYTAEHPRDPRWFYYLGDAYAGLGRHEEAIAAFRACHHLNGWDEEGAWAMYRAAESLLALGRPADAVAACAAGMTRHAGLAELPWLAAYASWHAGRPEQAIFWARLSATLGWFIGSGPTVPRAHFRHPPALWEGPFDILRYALRATGDQHGADEAQRLFRRARRARNEALAG